MHARDATLVTLSWPRMRALVARWRRDRRRVVFTNGVFDILHAGHVELLGKARAKGDALVVGLNSDASVRRLKGPERPVNRWRDRAAVLAALACVDAVVGFGQDTPARLLEALRPDVLVKGADYALGEIIGAGHARRVVRVALKKGYSTTGIIRKLRAAT
ncbi:MAG: adenylyltransferase/cytidyltransferase family protein [Elusimicrobia bacterium]|nr:adenylyltransferase/cytidyltransferase family protein [Elusimicrobiota bacterium]